jgi:polysaccharide deacetylase 2 family uncharacterized protein YibQ
MFDKKNNPNITSKGRSFWLVLLISLIFCSGLGFVVVRGTINYQQKAVLAEVAGQSVTYSLSHDKIASAEANVKIVSPPVADAIKSTIIPRESSVIPKSSEENQLKQPIIAIIISGVGLSASSTAGVLKTTPEITIGLSPYATEINLLAKQFITLGHQVLMNIPLEPINYPIDDPGPYALLTSLSDKDNLDRLDALAGRAHDIDGFYTMDNEKFSVDSNSVKPIIDEISKRDLILVYGGGPENNSISQLAASVSFPLIISDNIIDNDITEEGIADKLLKLEQLASKNGYAVGIAHPYPITVNLLEKWMTTFPSKGFKMVGIKEIIYLMKKKQSE